MLWRKTYEFFAAYSETCTKQTPSGNAVVSAYNTGCPPNTGLDRQRHNEVSNAIQMNSGNVQNTPRETMMIHVYINFFIKVDQY